MMERYLKPTYFISSDHPDIIDYTRELTGDGQGDVEKAVNLYYAVRDQVTYNPYCISLEKGGYQAHQVLAQGQGFCVQKAILLAALARAVGIPSALRFAIVRNHLVTKRLKELMKTDLFVFHGLTEFYLNGNWVKATPAFNATLCDKFNVPPLEFDGTEDSVFHSFDREGRKFMEYIHDYGSFDDFPSTLMLKEFDKYYGHLRSMADNRKDSMRSDFEEEAAMED
jgi:transglutaminase-like putative cysteine protease